MKFDKETCAMELPEEYQFLDYGTDLYGPQSTLDEKGRRVLTAWLRMPEPVDGKWQGMMCIPRVVELKEGFNLEVYVNPNQISVFVNNGEAVVTNAVYGLEEKIEADVPVKMETIV